MEKAEARHLTAQPHGSSMRSLHSVSKALSRTVCIILCLSMMLGGTWVSPRPAQALSLSEEKELGRKLLEQIDEVLPLIKDGEVATYIQTLGESLVASLGTTSYDYRFFIVDQSIPNAFAVPGGYIFVFRGLIELMETEGELASILCHEIAHIEARHIHRRLEAGKVANVAALAGVLAAALLGAGGAASQGLVAGTLAGARSFQLKYSRDQEQEADQLGMRYLCKAGYPPGAMVSAMQKMARQSWRSNSQIPSYLSTHPALDERIHQLQKIAEGMECARGASAREGTVNFDLIQAALVADYAEPRIALDRFMRESQEGNPAGFYGLGRLYLRQGRFEDAVQSLQRVARTNPGNPLVLSALGTAHFRRGNLDEALKVLETALLLNPGDVISRFRLATVLQDKGADRQALDHLMRIEEHAVVYPEIDYRLGVLLGRMNRLGEAHYRLGRYHERQHEWRLSIFHYKKAEALLGSGFMGGDELRESIERVEDRARRELWQSRGR